MVWFLRKATHTLNLLNHLNFHLTSLLLTQPLQFRAGSVGFVKVRRAVFRRGAQQRDRGTDLRSKKSGLSCVEIRRTGLFIFNLRIRVVGGCEHRLLVNSSQMKVYDGGGPTALFELCRIDF